MTSTSMASQPSSDTHPFEPHRSSIFDSSHRVLARCNHRDCNCPRMMPAARGSGRLRPTSSLTAVKIPGVSENPPRIGHCQIVLSKCVDYVDGGIDKRG